MTMNALLIINILVLVYFFIINGVYLTLVLTSYFSIKKYNRLSSPENWRRVIQSPTTIPISILAPAHNEAVTIENSLRSLLALQYPLFEIIAINDGSTDNTLEIMIKSFQLKKIPVQLENQVPCCEIRGVYRSSTYKNLVVVDKVNGGKADALNAGINLSRYPIFCAIDADSIIESDALLRITRPFLEKPLTTVAVGGIIRIANGCQIERGFIKRIGLPKNWLALFQTIEYMRAFLFGRTGWNSLGGLLIISGAFGIFKKSTVISVGGYATDTVGEDMELITRMHYELRKTKQDYDITFMPDPVCWTEVPETVKVLARQRNRWQRGLIDSLFRHMGMLFNPRYGMLGLVAFPYFFFVEMLGPVFELFGYAIIIFSFVTGALDIQFFILFLGLAILLGMTLSTASLVLDEIIFRRFPNISDIFKLLAVAILENFGYRQMHTWWRLTGIIDYLRKKRGWGKMERKGFNNGQDTAA